MNNREMDRTSNIIRTLARYYLQKGCRDFKISLDVEAEEFSLGVEGSLKISAEEVAALEANLGKPASPEMSHYYDELLSSGGDDEDMSLLGYLIDVSEVEYKDGMLFLRLRRCCGL